MSDLYSRSPSIEMAPLQEETILFNPAKNQFCVLNRTASVLWSQLATPTSADTLAAKLCQSFSGVGIEDALRDADMALKEMISLNFVVGESSAGENQ
jgi:hypothetical protein